MRRRPAHRLRRLAERLVGRQARPLSSPDAVRHRAARAQQHQLLDDHPRAAERAATVPPGFQVRRFHVGADQPRLIRTAPNGDIFVAESEAGRIRVLRPSGTCQLGASALFASGLDLPFGIAFYPPGPNPTHVYVAESGRVVRYRYAAATSSPARARRWSCPPAAGCRQPAGQGALDPGHRVLRERNRMFVSVGSYSNVQQGGEDETERAAILEFAARRKRSAHLRQRPA